MQCFLAGFDRGGINVTIADEFYDTHALRFIVFDQEQLAGAAFGKLADLIEGG